VLLEKWGSAQEFTAHQRQPAIRAFFGDQLGELLADDMSVHYDSLLSPTA
jgi:quinol monooxygenase YgiN